MIGRAAFVVLACAVSLAGCGRQDPADDPEYAAACHGAPIHDVETRNKALEDGYSINARFDCIDKRSWEAVQKANAKQQAQAQARDDGKQSLAQAREGFRTQLGAPASGKPLPDPPKALFVRADYTGGEGRKLAAFVSPDPRDHQRHAAIVWITGGDSNTLEDFWTEGKPDNDQSASAFRKAGVIMMFPTLRGGNTDTGRREFFYGEVDDVHAAANLLAKLPYVDPARIYLGGHSTGGTLALLAAETGGRFAAVFAFGAVSEIDHYPPEIFVPPPPGSDMRELELRSPIHWLDAISTPTYIIEGTREPSNSAELDELCHHVHVLTVHCVPVFDSNHFSVIDRAAQVLAPELAAGTMGEVELLRSQDFRGELPGQ